MGRRTKAAIQSRMGRLRRKARSGEKLTASETRELANYDATVKPQRPRLHTVDGAATAPAGGAVEPEPADEAPAEEAPTVEAGGTSDDIPPIDVRERPIPVEPVTDEGDERTDGETQVKMDFTQVPHAWGQLIKEHAENIRENGEGWEKLLAVPDPLVDDVIVPATAVLVAEGVKYLNKKGLNNKALVAVVALGPGVTTFVVSALVTHRARKREAQRIQAMRRPAPPPAPSSAPEAAPAPPPAPSSAPPPLTVVPPSSDSESIDQGRTRVGGGGP